MTNQQLRRAACLAIVAGFTIGLASAERGGGPVSGTDHEERCATMIAAIVDGTDITPYLSDLLIVGPGFTHSMSGDQAKFPYGKAMLMQGTYGGRQMFFLGRGVQDEELVTMLKSSEFREFLRGFKSRDAKPATQAEREIYYSLIAWEIEGQPVTVIRDDTRRLLIHNTDEGKLFWIDMIDQYPVPSIAENVDEAIKLLSAINASD
jgi:hypothetical protein